MSPNLSRNAVAMVGVLLLFVVCLPGWGCNPGWGMRSSAPAIYAEFLNSRMVQKSFLRKSQTLHLNASSTTYATAKLTQTRSPHKLSGSEQLNPFGRSLKGAVAQKTRTKQQSKKEAGQNLRGYLHSLLCSFLWALEPEFHRTVQLQTRLKSSRSKDLPNKNS